MTTQKPPRRLYKYLPPERTDVLLGCRIRYTQLGAFNDPFEGRPYMSAFNGSGDIEREILDMVNGLVASALDGVPENEKAAQLRSIADTVVEVLGNAPLDEIGRAYSDAAPITGVEREAFYSELDRCFGILSLSEVSDNLLMWAHYAASHTGFVLGFDCEHPYFNEARSELDELRHLRRVRYVSERPRAPFTELTGEDFFLTKNLHWEYEREWRILRPLSDASARFDVESHSICLFAFPPECISEVILGAKISVARRSELLSAIKQDPRLQHIEVRAAQFDSRDYALRLQILDVRQRRSK